MQITLDKWTETKTVEQPKKSVEDLMNDPAWQEIMAWEAVEMMDWI